MSTHALPQHERRRGERRAGANGDHAQRHEGTHLSHRGNYGRFAAMVTASTLLGFAGMYLNTYAWDHVYFSWTRLFMTLIMGGIMTAVMMLFMWNMYPNQRTNYAVLGIAAALLVGGIGLARTQATVNDVTWMKAMIPHHSIAILTSERASMTEPRVRQLADQIIETQRREIAEMKALIDELERR